MSEETIVAVYDSAAHAEAAVQDLRAANVPAEAITQHGGTGTGAGVMSGSTTASGPVREKGFWSGLFGGEPDHDTAVYDRSLQGGSTVVTVKAPQQHVDSVAAILDRHNPIDIDDRASGYGLSQPGGGAAPLATASTATAGAEEGVIPLSQEQLVVGKRAVNRGTTRVRRFVVETPVEEQVTLRDETVHVERRPVTGGRTTGVGDFTDKTIEVRQAGEEAVVGKTAHVREEVVVRKEAQERVETVHDTVRREEVAVEPSTTGTGTGSTGGLSDTTRAPKV